MLPNSYYSKIVVDVTFDTRKTWFFSWKHQKTGSSETRIHVNIVELSYQRERERERERERQRKKMETTYQPSCRYLLKLVAEEK